MSFSFGYYARNKEEALALLEQPGFVAPACVKEMVRVTLRNFTHKGIVRVKAQGHLCEGPQSYEVSYAKIIVEPIAILELEKPV